VKPKVRDCASQTEAKMVEQEVQTKTPAPVEKQKVILNIRREVEVKEELEEEEEDKEEEEEEELNMEEEIATFRKLVHAYKNKAGLARSHRDRISYDLRDFARNHNIMNSPTSHITPT
jgi:hypothetical protein